MRKPAVKHDFSADSRGIHGIGTAETTRDRNRSKPVGFSGVRRRVDRARFHRPEYTPCRFSSRALTASRWSSL